MAVESQYTKYRLFVGKIWWWGGFLYKITEPLQLLFQTAVCFLGKLTTLHYRRPIKVLDNAN